MWTSFLDKFRNLILFVHKLTLFFFKLSFWQFFDIQMAIFRRVSSQDILQQQPWDDQLMICLFSGEKPYVCTVKDCNKRFTEYSSLYKHHVVHTHTKPYTCNSCGKTYRQTSTLAMHKRTAHGEEFPQELAQNDSNSCEYTDFFLDLNFRIFLISPLNINFHF